MDFVLLHVKTEIAKGSFFQYNRAKMYGLTVYTCIKDCSSVVVFKDVILSYYNDRAIDTDKDFYYLFIYLFIAVINSFYICMYFLLCFYPSALADNSTLFYYYYYC